MKSLVVVFFLLLQTVPAGAATDPVAYARQLATSGRYPEAILMLEQRLAAQPDDIDARTLLGIVLSWDRQYGRAREELRRVLAKDPKNSDARQALARVELWSRHTETRSELMIGGNYDDYGQSDPFREAFLSLKLNNRVAPIVLRAARAKRFGRNDWQFDAEAYPRFGARTYAYLAAGYSPDGVLYPDSHYGAELFQGFAKGWEASAGARRLNFAKGVSVYTASLGKYVGNWLLDARGYDAGGTKSGLLMARYYFGEGGQYAGLRVGRGSTRDEIRTASDLASLSKWEIAAETRLMLRQRWLLEARASQKSASLGLGLRF